MIILGIETSCDETAVSIVEANGDLESLSFKLLGSALHSQIDTHREFGGVVPMLAKREHIKNLPLVLEQALKGAENLPIDMIAVTVGPGLEPALWTGITFAKELGEKWQIPVVPTNHMEGHVVSALLQDHTTKTKRVDFPALALLISGGHTELILLNNWLDKKKIGETQDDAVGEAFDKVARMLQLPYPGGPEISKLAEEARVKNIKLETKFPRPMIHSKDFNFSFSGLKTAVLYYLKDTPQSSDSATLKLGVAREFEDAVVEVLVSKTKIAIEKYDPKTLIIGGGVIANKTLRENFLGIKKDYPDLKILIPEKQLTTDNATMIAMAAYVNKIGNNKQLTLEANGNLDID